MKKIPQTTIFEQRIDRVTLPEVMSDIEESIRRKRKALYFALNIHILLALRKDAAAQQKHNQARIVYADGVPLVWLSQWSKYPLPGRVSGTDVVEHLLQNKRNKIFVLGGTDSLLATLHKKYPQSVVGVYAPPFGSAWNKKVDEEILVAIDTSGAEILLVAVGALKQERWLWKYFERTSCLAGLGVGSALEILTGEKRRAPVWMQGFGLEWVWSIVLEPKRLLFRYIYDGLHFATVMLFGGKKF